MPASNLKSYTCKDLAQMARRQGIAGWHSMRKDELVAALVQAERKSARKPRAAKSGEPENAASVKQSAVAKTAGPALTPARRRAQQQLAQLHQQNAERKNLSSSNESGTAPEADRVVVMVRDPYWLHVCWEVSPATVERARTALGQRWHIAVPTLRIMRSADETGWVLEKTIEIHGGVSNWYVDVSDPPSTYRVELGYQSGTDFYCIARSNTVTTPAPGAADVVDGNWSDVAENADRIFAMSGGYSADGASMELQELLEQRLRRRMGRPSEIRYGRPSAKQGELQLAVDSELIVYGSTEPHTHVTISGEPVKVDHDGAFAVKLHLPDRRQVIPVVASSADGVEQKTVILGVERNTKALDPVVKDMASPTAHA